MRVLLYSHDTLGLGHTRRSQAIAFGLAEGLDDPTILIVSGAPQSTMFNVPSGTDYVIVPSLKKSTNDVYVARNSNLDIAEVINMRGEILRSVVQSFRPDVFIVDKVPRGVCGEVEPALEAVRFDGHARCVLGLRDILDEPGAVRREWDRGDYERIIEEYYDAVWVYGDSRICDVANECHFAPQTAAKLQYTGYLDRWSLNGISQPCEPAELVSLGLSSKRFILCTVGGGEDGASLARAFARTELPAKWEGVILTGPYMPSEVCEELRAQASQNPRLHIIDFLMRSEWLLARAERVITMGGYNTMCEVISRQKAALVVPRVTPRTEQLIRAERMQQHGLVEMLHPKHLTPRALETWLRRPLAPPTDARTRIDLNGLSRVPQLITKLVENAGSTDELRPQPERAAVVGEEKP